MSIILSYNALAAQFPQSSKVITASRHQVRRVGAESAVPNPALMRAEVRLHWERAGGTVLVGAKFVREGRKLLVLLLMFFLALDSALAGTLAFEGGVDDGPDACAVVGGAGR